ncbi:hypothetical protein ACLHZW_17585 [Aeromonas media]|uniref:hypothetical protein n=1 Tax=Aeromonas media TaxID=651 RepID=UPI003D03E92A
MAIKVFQKLLFKIKNFMFFYQNYSIAISTFSVVIFSAGCYFMVTSYISDFGLQPFIFLGGVSDVYLMALYQGIVIKILSIAFLIAVVSMALYATLTDGNVHNDLSKTTASTSRNIFSILSVAIIFIGSIGSLIVFNYLPKAEADEIKAGFSARYDIETKKDLKQCHSIIGSTSSYILIWNNESKIASVLPKSEIESLSLVVPQPPARKDFGVTGNRYVIPTDEYKRRAKYRDKVQRNWSSILAVKCNQHVEWHGG